MVTIYDIAKEAGVSHSTVSRILSGKKQMSGETTQKVLEIAQRLGYKHKNITDTFPKCKTQTIGIVTQTFLNNPFFLNVYNSIYINADKMGYSLLLCRMDYTNAHQSNVDFIKAFDGKVDGIIFVGQLPLNESVLQPLIEKKYPMVSLFNKISAKGVINIDSDNFQGAYDITSYLIKLGHTRIAHMVGHGSNIHSMERKKGYMKALEDNGIPFDNNLIRIGNFSYIESYQCSMDLLNIMDKFTAVFCGTDEMASAFIDAAKEKGLRVPNDISVVGFDDIKPDNFLAKEVPFITTVRQPREELSNYALNSLFNLIHGIEVPSNKTFQLEVIIRNSAIENTRS